MVQTNSWKIYDFIIERKNVLKRQDFKITKDACTFLDVKLHPIGQLWFQFHLKVTAFANTSDLYSQYNRKYRANTDPFSTRYWNLQHLTHNTEIYNTWFWNLQHSTHDTEIYNTFNTWYWNLQHIQHMILKSTTFNTWYWNLQHLTHATEIYNI